MITLPLLLLLSMCPFIRSYVKYSRVAHVIRPTGIRRLLMNDAHSVDEYFTGHFTRSNSTEYLVVKSLPPVFSTRYGVCPEKIYVRECYKELYDIASTNIGKNNSPVILFTGTPGIGKSLFLIYFIFRYLSDDRFWNKSFAVELKQSGNYKYYKPINDVNPAGHFTCMNVGEDNLPEIPVFTDLASRVEPGGSGNPLFIFSSPNPDRYKEVMKRPDHYEYIMPTWSEDELTCVNSNKIKWMDAFVNYGGIPRTVFSADSDKLFKKAIRAKGSAVALDVFTSGYGGLDNEISYMLTHVNPPLSPDTKKWLYDDDMVYSFASDHIFKVLCKSYTQQILAQAIHIFNEGVQSKSSIYGGGTAGNFFEKILLWLRPIAGTSIDISPLPLKDLTSSPSSPSSQIKINLPRMELLNSTWKDGQKLKPELLYQPLISNLESGNAFCILKNEDELYTLVVLQMTVGKDHPIKVNGLKAILSAFPEDIISKINKKLLIFVVPTDSLLVSIQPWHNKSNEVIERFPKELYGFEQWISKINISTQFILDE